MSAAAQWVVVDNTDPRITYQPADAWTLQTVSISYPTNSLVPPLYGTFQEYQLIDNATFTGNFTFAFTGLAVVAAFVSNISAMGSCTLDGQPMGVELVRNRLLCTSNYTIKHGGHQLIVTPNLVGLPLLFDFLKYDRGEPDPVADADVIYEDPSIESTSKVLEFSGDSLDLTFVGYSLGIYAFFNKSGTPAPASYSIDGSTPVNFTIINPTTDLAQELDGAIVLQTPRYPLNQHHFHLDFWGNVGTTSLTIDYIIVQNLTAPHVLLDPFPTPNPSSVHLGPIIGATAGAIILVLFVVLIFFAYRKRRRRLSASLNKTDNSDYFISVVEPFQQQRSTVRFRSRKNQADEEHNDAIVAEPEDAESNLLIEPFYHWRTHFRSFRKNTVHQRRSEPVPADTRNEPNPVAPISVQRPFQYRVHEDSGEQITQPDESIVIVDLPPTYTMIGFTHPAPTANDPSLEIPRDEVEVSGGAHVEGDPCIIGKAL